MVLTVAAVADTLFAWEMDEQDLRQIPDGWINFLARSPRAFRNSGSYERFRLWDTPSAAISGPGLSISLPILVNAHEQFGGAHAFALLCIVAREGPYIGVVGVALERGTRGYRRSARWMSPKVLTTCSTSRKTPLASTVVMTLLSNDWSTRVNMDRLSFQEAKHWRSTAPAARNLIPGPPSSPSMLGSYHELFCRFTDNDWSIERSAIRSQQSFDQTTLVMGREDLRPFKMHVNFCIGVSDKGVIVDQCIIKLANASDPRVYGEAVEVARLDAAVTLDPEKGPWEVLIVSWGLISIRMSAIGQGQGEEPVVVASVSCKATPPHHQYLQAAGVSLPPPPETLLPSPVSDVVALKRKRGMEWGRNVGAHQSSKSKRVMSPEGSKVN